MLVFALTSCENPDSGYQMSDSPRTQSRSAKRGVCFSFDAMPEVDATLLGPHITWWYNWGIEPSEKMKNYNSLFALDFCPMAWNSTFDSTRLTSYCSTTPSCQYLLAFNEPNLTDQCNETPAQSAANWHKVKSAASTNSLTIISPAMNYGTLAGYSDPIVWLDEFFTLVDIDDVDAIAIHCYMGSSAALKSYIDRFRKYGKPIWLTEFCAWEKNIGSIDAQIQFMSEAVAYLEADPIIERYAWFIPRSSGPLDRYPYNQLLTPTSPYTLSTLGQTYCYMSTQEKGVRYTTDQTIEAEHYTRCCVADCIGTDSYIAAPHLTPDTTSASNLILSLIKSQWIEYDVELPSTTQYSLSITYSTPSGAKLLWTVDGNDIDITDIPSTSSDTRYTLSTSIPAGIHTLRLTSLKNNIQLDNLTITRQ